MNRFIESSLQYIKNTNMGASKIDFYTDHAPIGRDLWNELVKLRAVKISRDGKIFLSDEGESLLQSVEDA